MHRWLRLYNQPPRRHPILPRLRILVVCALLASSCFSVELDDADRDGYSPAEGDCDDSQSQIHPGNGCGPLAGEENQEDQSEPTSTPMDSDGDGYSPLEGDCDDDNPTVYPGAPEIPDGTDNDCNGTIDDVDQPATPPPVVTPTLGPDSPFPPAGRDADQDGFTVDEGDCDDSDPTTYPGADEPPDGVDHDCDGQTTEAAPTPAPSTIDADQDGFSIAEGDCDDTNATVYPGAEEVDDGLDNDCDGAIDNTAEVEILQSDADGDGVTEEQGDCDDADPTVYPDAVEIDDGQDNNCNGLIDDVGVVVVGDAFVDDDNDGYTEARGDCDDSDPTVYPTDATTPHTYLECGSNQPDLPIATTDQDRDGVTVLEGDCNDYNNTVYPGATEQCNSIDDDCDGKVDENLPVGTYYGDSDNDGFGTASVIQLTCAAAPDGFSYQAGDCNDTDPDVNPGAEERCNGVDDNCNGEVDESTAVDAPTWYADADGDGYGNREVSETACYPPSGYVTNGQDCDDSDPDVNPGATEFQDHKDNNCDGEVDE